MRRARLLETGWEGELAVQACDVPEATGNRVLVQVEACGVCYRDLIDRAGRFRFIQLPITPGHEAVGRVIAVGSQVTEWRPGDRVATLHRDFCGVCPACNAGETSLCTGAAAVFGLLIDGGYATHLVAPERALYAVPPHLPAAEAAILHCTFGTAYRGLMRAGLRAGQRVLVTGANGGVGAAALQVVQRLRAHPVAVIRNAAQREFVEALGAESVIVDDGTSFHKSLTDPVDIALDCVGEPTFNAALRSLAVGGRIVAIGNVKEERVPVNLGYLITRGVTILGSSGATRADMQAVLSLYDSLPFTIPIHARLPLDRADFAQRVVREGGLRGRVVLALEGDESP